MPTLKVLGQSKVGTVIKTVRSALGVDIRIFDQSGNIAQDDATLGSIRSRSPKQVEIRVVGQTLAKNVIAYFEENYGVNIEILTGDGSIAIPNMTLGSVRKTYTPSGSVPLEEVESSDTDIIYETEDEGGKLDRGHENDLEINVIKFEIEAPNSDGEYPISLEIEVKNNAGVGASLLKYDIFYFRDASKLIGSSMNNTEWVDLQHGDVETIHNTWGYIDKRLLDGKDNVTARIQARLFREETIPIGQLSVPVDLGLVHLEQSIDTCSIANNFGLTLSRFEVDEDGDVQVRLMGAMTNLMDVPLEGVELKATFFDEAGDKVDYTEAATDVRPFLMGVLDTGIWAKPKDLEGVTASLALVIYHQIKAGTFSADTFVSA